MDVKGILIPQSHDTDQEFLQVARFAVKEGAGWQEIRILLTVLFCLLF